MLLVIPIPIPFPTPGRAGFDIAVHAGHPPGARVRSSHVWRRLLPVLLLIALGPSAAQPVLSVGGELSAGYDSNPAQSAGGPGLAFIRAALDAAQAHRLGNADLTLGVNAWYRDYEADNDSYRLSAVLDWTRLTAAGAGQLGLSAAGAVYRDALVAADERNEAALTLRYDHTLTARDAVAATAEVRWLAYRNASLPWAGRPGSGAGNGFGGPPSASSERRGKAEPEGRDDRLAGLELGARHHWSPKVESLISVVYARNHSPVPVEAYTRAGVGLSVRAEPVAHWRVQAGIGWSRTRYDRAPRRRERTDFQHDVGVAVSRALGDSAVFCGVDWLRSDSTIGERSFRQTVTECGLSHAF
jgi:hypothetical protein